MTRTFINRFKDQKTEFIFVADSFIRINKVIHLSRQGTSERSNKNMPRKLMSSSQMTKKVNLIIRQPAVPQFLSRTVLIPKMMHLNLSPLSPINSIYEHD